MRITVGELFDSGLSVCRFIEQMQEEFSSYGELEFWRIIEWINILEQLVYSEVVQYESFAEIRPPDFSINYIDFVPPKGIDTVRFSDIFAIRCDNEMLSLGRDCDSDMIKGTYFDRRGRLFLNVEQLPELVCVYFNARPKLITEETKEHRNIHIPPEFLDLFRSRIRGEYYKYINEDAMSAKWITEYNVILENFKEWCKNREELFK